MADDWRAVIASPEWAAAVSRPDRVIDARVEAVDLDGVALGEVLVDGARISFRGSQTEQWSADFTFSEPELVPYAPSSWLDGRSGVRLRTWWRLHTASGVLEVPVCTVVVEDPSGTDDGVLSASVSGLDPLAIARRGGYGSSTIAVGGMTVSAALGHLFDALLPGWPISIEPSTVLLPPVYDLWDREPAEDWTEIAAMAGMAVRTDRMGVIGVGRPHTGAMVGDWSEGTDSPVIRLGWEQRTSTISRRVVVVSTSPDVVPPVVGVWEHPDVLSQVLVTETRIESSTVTTAAAAKSLARMTGERWARRQLSVDVTIPQRPDLGYRDQAIVTRQQSQIHGVFEVAGWDLTLAGAASAPAPMLVHLMTRLGDVIDADGSPDPEPEMPTYAQEVLADGPTLFYLLDEAASPGVDLAGTTTQSTITGVSWAQAGIGAGATSAAFASGSLRTSTAAALGGHGAITLEALVHATDWSGDRLVVAVSEAGSEVIFLRPQNGVLRMTIETSAGNYTTITGSTVMTTVRTYHIAGTWDGSQVRLYVDGVLDTTVALGSRFTPASAPFVQLGRRPAGSDSYFAGRLAGVAVHMGALSGARILAHAQAAGL